MTAYYNEIDRFNCDWLSNMMDANLITPGKIDDRSIVDVRPDDLAGFERVHFFAGIGGWDYALRLAGWTAGSPVWTGSCPCQPFSLAGAQRGFADERHLWPTFRGLIEERNPPVVFGEQVASASQWLGLVRSDLEALGYAVGCLPIQAASAGADHLRDRYWFVADADDAGSQGREVLSECAGQRAVGADGLAYAEGQRGREMLGDVASQAGRWPRSGHSAQGRQDAGDVADSHGDGTHQGRRDIREVSETAERPSGTEHGAAVLGGNGVGSNWHEGCDLEWVIGADGKARRVKSGIRLLAHGVPNRVGLLRGFGNAIDPRPAAEFIGAYMTARGLAVSSHHNHTRAD